MSLFSRLTSRVAPRDLTAPFRVSITPSSSIIHGPAFQIMRDIRKEYTGQCSFHTRKQARAGLSSPLHRAQQNPLPAGVGTNVPLSSTENPQNRSIRPLLRQAVRISRGLCSATGAEGAGVLIFAFDRIMDFSFRLTWNLAYSPHRLRLRHWPEAQLQISGARPIAYGRRRTSTGLRSPEHQRAERSAMIPAPERRLIHM